MPNIDYEVQFKFGDQSEYDSLSGLGLSGPDPDTIYFTTDTKRIYVGELNFNLLVRGLKPSQFDSTYSPGIYYTGSSLSPGDIYLWDGESSILLESYEVFSRLPLSDMTTNIDSSHVPTSGAVNNFVNDSLEDYYNKDASDNRFAQLPDDDRIYAEINNPSHLAGEANISQGLTENNFSNKYRSKLDYLVSLNLGNDIVQADFKEVDDTSRGYIFNKPKIDNDEYPNGDQVNLVSWDTFNGSVNGKLNKVEAQYDATKPLDNKLVEIVTNEEPSPLPYPNNDKIVQSIKYRTVKSNDLGVKLAGDSSSEDWTLFSPTSNKKYVADLSGKVVESVKLNGNHVDLGSNGEIDLECATSIKVGEKLIALDTEDPGSIDLTNQFAKSVSATNNRGGIVQSTLREDGDIDITDLIYSLTNLPAIPNEFEYLRVIEGNVKFEDSDKNTTNLEDDGEVKVVIIDQDAELGKGLVKFDEYVNVDDYQKDTLLKDCSQGSGELINYYTFDTDDTDSSKYKLNRDTSLEFQYSSEVSSPITVNIYPANVKVILNNFEDWGYQEGCCNQFSLYVLVYERVSSSSEPSDWSTTYSTEYYTYDSTTGKYVFNETRNFLSAVSQPGGLYHKTYKTFSRKRSASSTSSAYVVNKSQEEINPDFYRLGDIYLFVAVDTQNLSGNQPEDWDNDYKLNYYTYDSNTNKYTVNEESNWSSAIAQSGGLHKGLLNAKVKLPKLPNLDHLPYYDIALIDDTEKSYDNSQINSYYHSSGIDVFKNYDEYCTIRSIVVNHYNNYVQITSPGIIPPSNWSTEYNIDYYTRDSYGNYVLNNISNWIDAVNQEGGLYVVEVNIIEYDPFDYLNENSSYMSVYYPIQASQGGHPFIIYLREHNILALNSSKDYYIQLLDPSYKEGDTSYLPTLEFKINLSGKVDYYSDPLLQIEVPMYLGGESTISSSEVPPQEFILSSVFSNNSYPSNLFDEKPVAIHISSNNQIGVYSNTSLNILTNSFLGNYLEGNVFKDIVNKYILSEDLPGTSSLKFTGYYPEVDYKYSSINKYTNYVASFSWSSLKVTINSNENLETCYISSIDSLLNDLPQSYSISNLVISEIVEGSSQQIELNNLVLGHTYKVEYFKDEVLNFAIKIKLPDEIEDSFIIKIFNSKINNSDHDFDKVPDNSYYFNNSKILRDEYFYVPVNHAYGISTEVLDDYEEYRNYGNETFLVDNELLNFKFNLYLARNYGSRIPPLFDLSDDITSGIPTATTSITRYHNNPQDSRIRFNFEGLYIVPYVNNFKEGGSDQ